MIVNLHIDRLVLDGLPVGTHEAPLVQAAVEAELARLLGEGLDRHHQPSGHRKATIAAGPIWISDGDLAAVGRRIARSIHEGIMT